MLKPRSSKAKQNKTVKKTKTWSTESYDGWYSKNVIRAPTTQDLQMKSERVSYVIKQHVMRQDWREEWNGERRRKENKEEWSRKFDPDMLTAFHHKYTHT